VLAALAGIAFLGISRPVLFADAQVEKQAIKVELEQCANENHDCTTDSSSWVTGALNVNNSVYAEGDSVPYRASFRDLTVGETYFVTIEWDSLQSGKHAIDYLTTYTRTETTAMACDTATCGIGTPATIAIPTDASLGSVPQVPGSFTLYGATFTPQGTTIANPGSGNLCTGGYPCPTPANPSPYTIIDDSSSKQRKQVTVYFTATNAFARLAWGGHIASQTDWGVGNSAISIQGSPYHMRLVEFRCSDTKSCSVGNMDVSMSTSAIAATTTTTSTTSTTSTTIAGTTTTAPPPATTAPPAVTTPVVTPPPADLQVITPAPDDLQIAFPDELAVTGGDFSWVLLVTMMMLIAGALTVAYSAIRRLATDNEHQ
jgi:hypothetical protein